MQKCSLGLHLTVGQCSDRGVLSLIRHRVPHMRSPFSLSTATLGPAPSFLESWQSCVLVPLTLVFKQMKECQHFFACDLRKPLSPLSHMTPVKAFLRGDALPRETLEAPKLELPVLNSVSVACSSSDVPKASTCIPIPGT